MKISKKKISVIIPTYNSWVTLKPCLISIYNQTLIPAEVLVIDNASLDKTSSNVKKYFPKVKLIRMSRNTGVTGGRNKGIEKANKNSSYLFFFDHDMVAEKNMLQNLVQCAEEDNTFGIITPKIYYWEDKQRVWSAGTNINLWTGQILFRGGRDKGQFDMEEKVQVAPAAMLVKKSVIDQIHEFDDRYFATYEDTDFCFRAKMAGFNTVYMPTAIAFHKISPDISKEQQRLLNRAFWIGRNRILFMGEYGMNFYLFLLFSPVYLFYFILLSLKQKDYKGLVEYLRGVSAGLVEELISKRILIHLPLTMYNILLRAIGEDKKTVLDVACGDGLSMSILNYQKNWDVTGIDIYKPYVDRARQRGVYEEVILGDIRQIDKIFKKRKFDVVLISSVLDHIEKSEALELIKKCEGLGRKVILSGLPNGFHEKHEAYFWEGDNPHQEHKSHWSIEEFKEMAYTVRGFGNSFMIGEHRISGMKLWNRNKILSTAKIALIFLENLLAYFLAPLTFYNPKNSVCLIAIKEKLSKK